ncbi:MAG: DinB family protein [Acidobacteriaceae bacterium]
MFTRDGILKFHGWTHASIRLLLDHLSTLPETDYVKILPGFGFSTLGEQVLHLLNSEGFWVHALQGLRYTDRNLTEYPLVADARVFEREISRQTHEYLSKSTDQQMNRDMEIRFPAGNLAVRTPALVLHHVFTHAFHHKGQIVAMCRLLGHPAPYTDLIESA